MLNFVVAGAQKSGSTFIHRCLEDHPEVFMPHQEIRTFEDPVYSDASLRELEAILCRGQAARVRGIKRPDYLARPECAARIRAYAPQAKIIIALRDPVARAVSAYFHLMSYGFIPIVPVNEGLQKILDGAYDIQFPKAREIVEYGLYGKHLARYFELFDRRQVLTLVDMLFLRDQRKVIREIYEFLGIGEAHLPRSIERRENPGIYSLERLRFVNLRSRYAFRYSADRTHLDVRKDIAGIVANLGIRAVDRFLLQPAFGNAKPVLDEALHARLSSIYSEDIRRVEALLGVDLSGWRRGPA